MSAFTPLYVRQDLGGVKASVEYRAFRPRLSSPAPADQWESAELRFYRFDLRAPDDDQILLFAVRNALVEQVWHVQGDAAEALRPLAAHEATSGNAV